MAMQHKAFQCAPQSILASHPIIPHISDQRLRKRSRKPSNKGAFHRAPDHSASASSWGAADPSEHVEVTSDSDSEEEIDCLGNTEGLDPSYHGASAVKKRRYLANEDLGRFAKMSIDRDAATISPSSVYFPPTPQVAPPISPFFNSNDLREVSASSVEEPAEADNDTAMQAKRGPTIHQLDNNRFFVSSLSDDSSDEEDKEEKANQENVDAALYSGQPEEQDGNLRVNGELINRLQAMESQRRRAIHRDQAFQRRRNRDKNSDESGSSTPTGHQNGKNALILWKKPEDLLFNFGGPTSPSALPQATPPVVLEEDGYAYVHRPSPPKISPFASQNCQRGENDMELDDD